tara:strand:- start:26 stop:895 length:870 start_codon:yes stop_codon:yes gene_type:complete
MSGGGGSSSDSGGGSDRAAAAKAAMTSQAAYTSSASKATAPQVNIGGGDGGNNNDQYTQDSLKRYEASREDYDEPDKDHFKQTQKEIAKKSKDVVDTKMSKEQYEKFNEDLNKYYGTEDVKYEPYGRAGKGTVNLTFKEHYNNVVTQNPALKLSPVLAFLTAAGRNVGEYLTTDYGTYKYAGPGTDSGGLLGSGERTRMQNDREIMRNLAPDAPYIVSGLDQPDSSPAADFFANMNKNKHELFFQDQYDSAKAKMQGILGTPSPMRYLAVNESPFYNWLKDNSLDKGIL